MATTTNKQKLLTHLFSALGKAYKAQMPAQRPVLEQFLYSICRENATRELADQAFEQLKSRFFDWNEVRVSGNHEIAEALEGLSEPEVRAQRIIGFLQEVFETTFSFEMEGIEKKGLKQAAKQLARYQASNDYAVSWVVQQSLGGHAIPLDSSSIRSLQRLGLLDDDGNQESMRLAVEHQVPKAKGPLFVDLLSQMVDDYCTDIPNCSRCPLHSQCATAQAKPTPVAAGSRSKPR